MTAQLSWHVQNFVAIWQLEITLQPDKISMEIEFVDEKALVGCVPRFQMTDDWLVSIFDPQLWVDSHRLPSEATHCYRSDHWLFFIKNVTKPPWSILWKELNSANLIEVSLDFQGNFFRPKETPGFSACEDSW